MHGGFQVSVPSSCMVTSSVFRELHLKSFADLLDTGSIEDFHSTLVLKTPALEEQSTASESLLSHFRNLSSSYHSLEMKSKPSKPSTIFNVD